MLRRFRPLVLAPLAAAFLTTSLSAQSLDRLRDEAQQEVVGMAKLSQEIVDMIFSFSELGFQEKWTAEYITGLLRDEGVLGGPFAVGSGHRVRYRAAHYLLPTAHYFTAVSP